MNRFALGILTAAALFALATCATTGGKLETEHDNDSLVFGYLDMSQAKGHFEWVQMQQLQPPTDKPYYNCYADKGLFWHPRVAPGTYKFLKFGGMDGIKIGSVHLFGSTEYQYNFPRQGKGDLDPVIEKPGLYFVGAYKVVVKRAGIFKPDEFDIQKTDSPTEKELLQQLLAKDDKGEWRARIEKRLTELH